MTKRLEGKRVLVTQAADYMGPATIELFKEHGAEVIADESDLTQPGAAQGIVDAAGHIDVLVANLAADARFGLSTLDTDDAVGIRCSMSWCTPCTNSAAPSCRRCIKEARVRSLPLAAPRGSGHRTVSLPIVRLERLKSAMSDQWVQRLPPTTCRLT